MQTQADDLTGQYTAEKQNGYPEVPDGFAEEIHYKGIRANPACVFRLQFQEGLQPLLEGRAGALDCAGAIRSVHLRPQAAVVREIVTDGIHRALACKRGGRVDRVNGVVVEFHMVTRHVRGDAVQEQSC